MTRRDLGPDNTEFVILSFEGPDRYSRAGGLGVRVDHLSTTLAGMGFRTHLFFVGDPELKGEEVRRHGKLVLHRWCQWVSKYYPSGVYEGENEKLYDFNKSIPGYIKDYIVKPALARGKLVAILGEEWQTAEVICHLSDALYSQGLRDKVLIFWNANNTFSFHRVNWGRLNYATTITTVSRYMKHTMWRMGLNPLVIPNGIPRSLLRTVDDRVVDKLRQALGAQLMLCKVARWDPDKRWNGAVEAVHRLKQRGLKVVLLARGGIEPHGEEIMYNARSLGLAVRQATVDPASSDGFLSALHEASPADIIDIKFHLPLETLRFLYRASDGVLANSGHEPFGIVGLEAMAAGGVAFTGCTGEDYAIPFVNAFVLETADPMEIVNYVMYLCENPDEGVRIRKAAKHTARYFTWDAAVNNLISKLKNQARIQGILSGTPAQPRPLWTPPELLIGLLPSKLRRHYADRP